MERKPITPMLKVVSILHVIQSAISSLIGILALITLAAAPSLLEGQDLSTITPFTYITQVILLICSIVNIVLAVMALRHNNLGLVYKIAVVSTVFLAVFSVVGIQISVANYISFIISMIIPFLFLFAVFKQNKLDEGK